MQLEIFSLAEKVPTFKRAIEWSKEGLLCLARADLGRKKKLLKRGLNYIFQYGLLLVPFFLKQLLSKNCNKPNY